MNIQFMTAEANGIPTGEHNWKDEPEYTYIPNYEVMIARASCEEEAEAIRECRDIMNKWGAGFTFEIVFTALSPALDPNTGKMTRKWQVLQHPWYRSHEGIYHTKEAMIREIEKCIEATNKA